MKLSHSKLAAIVFCALASVPLLRSADLSEADKQFLTNYEHVRAALAGDNLDSGEKGSPRAGGRRRRHRQGRNHCHRARRVRGSERARDQTRYRPDRLLRRELSDAEEGLGATERDNLQSVCRQFDADLRDDKEARNNQTEYRRHIE